MLNKRERVFYKRTLEIKQIKIWSSYYSRDSFSVTCVGTLKYIHFLFHMENRTSKIMKDISW